MSFPDLSDKEFVEKFINILDLSAKDTTYKFAFARFLLDYSLENDEPCVQFSTIAEYFLKYYWSQECRSKLRQTSLKIMKKPNENIAKKFLISDIIIEQFGNQVYPQEYKKIKEKEPEKIKNCIKKIEAKCFNDVTYAFQYTKKGKSTDIESRPFFNYEIRYTKPRYDRKYGLPIIDLKNGIVLNPKAMSFFKRYNVVLEKAIILEWARFVEKFNLGVPALIQKIEGKLEKRKSTTKEKKALEEFFKNCFYCNDVLHTGKETQVEHVIPWSYIRENEMWNFVLACQKCNCEKLGSLPLEKYFDCLIKRNKDYRDKIPDLEKSLSKLGEGFLKIINDHYENAESHGFQVYNNFSKLDSNFCQ